MALSQEKILLVESNPDIHNLISKQTLKPLGYQVYIVEDGSQAIREAAQS